MRIKKHITYGIDAHNDYLRNSHADETRGEEQARSAESLISKAHQHIQVNKKKGLEIILDTFAEKFKANQN